MRVLLFVDDARYVCKRSTLCLPSQHVMIAIAARCVCQCNTLCLRLLHACSLKINSISFRPIYAFFLLLVKFYGLFSVSLQGEAHIM